MFTKNESFLGQIPIAPEAVCPPGKVLYNVGGSLLCVEPGKFPPAEYSGARPIGAFGGFGRAPSAPFGTAGMGPSSVPVTLGAFSRRIAIRTSPAMGFALQGPMGSRLGQANVNVDDRNAMLEALALADSQWITVSKWVATHVNPRADLAEDYTTFKNAQSTASSLYTQAMNVQQTLNSSSPSEWVVSTSDWNATNQWIKLVDQLFVIASQRTAISPAGSVAPVGPIPSAVLPGGAPAPSESVNPLLIGAIAVGAVGIAALLL